MKKAFILFAAFIFSAMLFAQNAKPKYVFLFIGDGMSVPQRMLAEEFSKRTGRGPLVINNLPYSCNTRTCSANAIITDSAASATAIACGEKTKNGQVGMSADLSRKLTSSAEVAHQNGKKVGIITSVTINHATPAGFYAHRPARGLMYQIGLDLIASNFEYFGGGGFSGQHDKKDDEQYKGNLYDLAAEAGYTIARTKAELLAIKTGTPKVLALYGEGTLPFAIDAVEEDPSLAEFVQKAIDCLEDGPNGFFIMTEGGAIDYRGHANEAAGNLREVLAFDDAVKVALKFYDEHPEETLIVTTGDHETGGMTMGFAGAGYGLNLDVLANQKCTPETFAKHLKKAKKAKEDFSFEDAKPLLNKYFGFVFDSNDDPKKNLMIVRENELKNLQEAYDNDKLQDAARILIQTKAGIGWSSGNHTALPTFTTAKGVGGERFQGFLENCDISLILKELVK